MLTGTTSLLIYLVMESTKSVCTNLMRTRTGNFNLTTRDQLNYALSKASKATFQPGDISQIIHSNGNISLLITFINS